MKLRTTLNRVVRVIVDESERNPVFEAALMDALKPVRPNTPRQDSKVLDTTTQSDPKRPKNRRPPALIDPVQLVRQGEAGLREALSPLSLDELRDVVAEYGMDTSRLVMKWTARERVIDRIVELSLTRAHKGDAFRKPSERP